MGLLEAYRQLYEHYIQHNNVSEMHCEHLRLFIPYMSERIEC